MAAPVCVARIGAAHGVRGAVKLWTFTEDPLAVQSYGPLMTKAERKNPDILKANRKKRIAAGSGTKVEEINKLLKMHRGMADMMKAMGGAKRGPMAQIANALGMGGGGIPSPEEMQKMAEQMQEQGLSLPPGMSGLPNNLPKNIPGMPGGLPGLGSPKLPGLGGFPGLGKKK